MQTQTTLQIQGFINFPIPDLFFFLKILCILRERGKGGRERGRETSTCGCLSCASYWGTWPTTQACGLTRNRTSDPLVRRPAFSPLSHTDQGHTPDLSEEAPFSADYQKRKCCYLELSVLFPQPLHFTLQPLTLFHQLLNFSVVQRRARRFRRHWRFCLWCSCGHNLIYFYIMLFRNK